MHLESAERAVRRQRRQVRRGRTDNLDTLSLASVPMQALAIANSAALAGDAAALFDSLSGFTLVDAPRDPPLLHTAVRAGSVACVITILLKNADAEARVSGKTALELARELGHDKISRVLEEAGNRLEVEASAALRARQIESQVLAERHEEVRRCGSSFATVTLRAAAAMRVANARPLSASRTLEQRALEDQSFRLACEYMAHLRGGACLACVPPEDADSELTVWLRSPGARSLFLELSEALPSVVPHSSGCRARQASGAELALAVRVVQLRLREQASRAAGKPLGQDALVPLLEAFLVFAQPVSACSTLARMRQDLSDAELLRKPDLASAVDGLGLAMAGVRAQALATWRTACRESRFFRCLCSQPPPNALLMSTCAQKRTDALAAVFGTFLRQLEYDEQSAWAKADTVEEHAGAVEALVADLLPTVTQEPGRSS